MYIASGSSAFWSILIRRTWLSRSSSKFFEQEGKSSGDWALFMETSWCSCLTVLNSSSSRSDDPERSLPPPIARSPVSTSCEKTNKMAYIVRYMYITTGSTLLYLTSRRRTCCSITSSQSIVPDSSLLAEFNSLIRACRLVPPLRKKYVLVLSWIITTYLCIKSWGNKANSEFVM